MVDRDVILTCSKQSVIQQTRDRQTPAWHCVGQIASVSSDSLPADRVETHSDAANVEIGAPGRPLIRSA